MPAAKVVWKDIDDCVLDLCCTSVQGPGDLIVSCVMILAVGQFSRHGTTLTRRCVAQSLKMREATVYSILLASAQGFVPDLARQLTGKALMVPVKRIHPPNILILNL